MRQLELMYSPWELGFRRVRKLLKPGILVALGVGFLAYRPGFYWSKNVFGPWCYLYFVGALGFSLYAARKISWLVFPILLLSLLSGAWLSAYYQNPYNGQLDVLTFLILGKNALMAAVALMLAAVFLAEVRSRYVKLARFGLVALEVVLIAASIWKWATGWKATGLVGTVSMNGCLVAALLPVLWTKVKEGMWPRPFALLIPLGVWVALLAHSSQPIGILTGQLFLAFYWLLSPYAGLLMAAAFLAAARVFFRPLGAPHMLFDMNGRWPVWQLTYAWWLEHVNHWWGAGLASGSVLIQRLQYEHGERNNFFPWLHSDWLQIGLELGYLGLAAALLAYGWLLVRAWRRPELAVTLLGFGMMGCFNYPLHMPIHAFSLLLLAYVIVREGNTDG